MSGAWYCNSPKPSNCRSGGAGGKYDGPAALISYGGRGLGGEDQPPLLPREDAAGRGCSMSDPGPSLLLPPPAHCTLTAERSGAGMGVAVRRSSRRPAGAAIARWPSCVAMKTAACGVQGQQMSGR